MGFILSGEYQLRAFVSRLEAVPVVSWFFQIILKFWRYLEVSGGFGFKLASLEIIFFFFFAIFHFLMFAGL